MRRGLGLLAAVVVLMVGFSVLAGVGYGHLSHAKAMDSERTEVAGVAGEYAVDFTSVDYRHLQTDINTVAQNATPDFAKKYREYLAVLSPIFTKGHVVQTTSVKLIGLTSITKTTAVVLVALTGTATDTKSTAGTYVSFRMQVTLQRQPHGGKWLASGVTPL